MEQKMKCPKCGGEMEEGIISPSSQPALIIKWGVLKKSPLLNKIENQIEITSYKCRACGYLESYAK